MRTMLNTLRKWIIYAMLAGGPAAGLQAMELQITSAANPDASVSLSLEDLDKLDQTEFSTTTIWTDSVDIFSGVSLKTLLAHLSATGETLELTALNDYAVTMPMAEIEGDAPIIATRMNGETMSVREKGPYWIIYPYDRDPSYRTESIYSRSIWQLNRLKVMD